MNSYWVFPALSILYGVCLGVFFFGGLHDTVVKGLTSPNPALWFVGSLMLRSAVVLSGFALVARNDTAWLALSLLGFVLARQIVLRVTSQCPAYQESPHAS